MAQDLFGNEIIINPLLRDKFMEPPFSILDTKGGAWRNRSLNNLVEVLIDKHVPKL